MAWLEYTLVEEVKRKSYSLIIGKVVYLEVDDNFFNEREDMNYKKAKPLSVILVHEGMYFVYPIFTGRYASYDEMFLNK